MNKLVTAATLGALVLAGSLSPSPAVVTLTAQTFPLTVNVGWDPDSSNQTQGYTISLDGATATDLGLPAPVSCTPLFGGTAAPCVPASVTISSAGKHTVTVTAYGPWGSAPVDFAFMVAPAPPPQHPRVIKPIAGSSGAVQ